MSVGAFPDYRHMLATYFDQADGRHIVSHQIESFNQFIEVDIPEIIHMANPILAHGSPEIPLAGPRSALATATGLSTTAANALMGDTVELTQAGKTVQREYEVTLEFEKISIRKPTIFENNGAIHPMMPNDARLRNLTYAAPLNIDVKVTTTFIDHTRNGIRESNVRIFPNVHLGKIPVMIGSKYCLLHDQRHVHPSAMGECEEDMGGYFIVQGGERAMISMERMSENRPFVFRNGRGSAKEVEVVEIKCIGPDNDQVPKSNTIKVVMHPKNPLITMLRVTVPRIKTDIPLFVLFRALGILPDRDIYEMILGEEDESSFDPVITETILEADGIRTQDDALLWLADHTNTWSIKAQKQGNVADILGDELFPHIGGKDMIYEKACFLAHMTRKVLWTMNQRIPTDDRDAYPNKRVDIPGFLLADLFRKTYNNRMVKDMKAALTKEIHGGSWKATGNWSEIVNINNINKIIKSTIMDVCLKSSLATGNFGSGKIGGPNKVGVSQVLNRLNYSATISHLRRISTPIEKTGKLIAPRKQHATQYGLCCPCETPEGHGVGVIKNMAITAVVSIFSSPITVYSFLQSTGSLILLREAKREDMHRDVRVFLNGSWIGLFRVSDALEVIDQLRKAKRAGKIHIYTGIIWKNAYKELWLTTEAGRMLRPLYYAPAVREIMENPALQKQLMELHDWNQMMLWTTPSGKNLIEYLDAGETDGAYIAMDYAACLKDPSYTHCEIHPSTIFGTTASYIPFPDHNQSPRNAYQCLWEKEEVLMASGERKAIGEVKVGEKVMSFDPLTGRMESVEVVNQYVRDTDKTIYKLTTVSGRAIVATDNHPFITETGWKSVADIVASPNQKIGIVPNWLFPDKNVPVKDIAVSIEDMVGDVRVHGLSKEMTSIHVAILKSLDLCPLPTNHPQLPVLARMVGALQNAFDNKDGQFVFSMVFPTSLDAITFEQDVASLGLQSVEVDEKKDGYHVVHRGDVFATLMVAIAPFRVKHHLTDTSYPYYPIPSWIMEGSDNTKREFLGGLDVYPEIEMEWNVRHNKYEWKCQVDLKNGQGVKEFSDQLTMLVNTFNIMSYGRIIYPNRNYIWSCFDEATLRFYHYIGMGMRYHTPLMIHNTKMMEYCRFVAIRIRDKIPLTKSEQWEIMRQRITHRGRMIFVPLESAVKQDKVRIADITVANDFHSFITSNNIGSHNSSMGKQAMGIYALNFRQRFDAMAHVLCYPEKPMVSSYMSRLFGAEKLPAGQNVVVAIMTYTGYNQEDSNMINRAALDRGRFRSIFYRTYKDEERKNQSSGEEEKFCRPDPTETKHMKNAHYEKVGDDGFVPKNTFVTPDDILIGKVVPLRLPTGAVLPVGAKKARDVSKMPRNNESGYVDKIYKNRNGEGYSFVKIRMRQDRIPEIGDKFSCFDPATDVLTTAGWVPFPELTMEHEVASLMDDGVSMRYTKPLEVMSYDFKGKMYRIQSNQVDLLVTPNHRMYVGNRNGENFGFKLAEEVYGKRWTYKKNIENYVPPVTDRPEELSYVSLETGEEMKEVQAFVLRDEEKGDLVVPIQDWLMLFGIWVAEGCISGGSVRFAAHKERVRTELDRISLSTGIRFGLCKDSKDDVDYNSYRIYQKRILSYFTPLSVGAVNKSLPGWVWFLTPEQCRVLIQGMMLGDGHTMENGTRRYDTSSARLANDFQRLCFHAGYSTNITVKYEAGHESTIKKDGRNNEVIRSTATAYRLTIIEKQNTPLVNKNIVLKTGENRHDGWEEYDGKVYCCRVEGLGAVYVRRNGLPVWSGNSRHGQKGTMGMILNPEDMPQTASGIVPDIIINPHAIPSRMTIAQLMETLMSKIGCMAGCLGDGTPFGETTVENLADMLRDQYGMEPYGNEIMYNGYTGRMMETSIFVGPCYYQRLRHCSADKMHSRASGPLVMLTRQPAEGRAREGGLRFGEMERDCVVAHGMAEFTKERLMECSDQFSCYSCKECGLLAVVNPEKNIWICRGCGNTTNFAHIHIPYATKLLLQELETMSIGSRMITQQKLITHSSQ